MSAHSAASPAASAERVAAPRSPPGALDAMAEGTLAMARPRCESSATTTSTSSPARCSRCCGCSSSAPRCAHNRALTLRRQVDYRAYLAPGVMAQAAMFIAIFFGLSVIWERDVGQLQRLLATPLSRSSIVLGKAAGACVRALVQALLLLVVLAATGIGVRWSVTGVLGTLAMLMLGTAAFACMSMLLAAGGEGARALHGHRPADHDAAVLRLERALPAQR